MRMYFEDFEAGQVFELGSKTLSRERILAFAEEFDPQPFHLDEAAAGESIYGGLIASGWHTGSVLMGLFATGLLNNTSSQGSPGVDELRWLKPVRPGDTLHGRSTILETRDSRSRPAVGLVQIQSELRNDADEAVLSLKSWGLFSRRPANTQD